MPPKRKLRVSSTAEPSTPSAATPGDISQAPDKPHNDKPVDIEPELWTDEEEISLFKGMIRWKPVGMHQRFRMISLSRHMRHHGHVSEHTKPQGIRQKLNVLYNIKVLDERENASVDDVEGEERHCEFSLPAGDFYDLMMTKRLDPERGSSPGWLDEPGDEDLDSSSDDSGEPQSSRASSVRGGRGGRRGRGIRIARGGRGRGQKDSVLRDVAKVQSDTSGEEEEDNDKDESEDGNQGQDEGEDEEDEDNEEEEDDTTQSNAAVSRNTRGRGRGRVSRGRGRGRRRG